MKARVTLAAAAVMALRLLAPTPAAAHGLEPALLSLRELTPGRFAVVWKSSKLRLPGADVRPILPARCRQTADPPQAVDDGDRLRLSWIVDCGRQGLAGEVVGVADLDVATIDALLRYEPLDGDSVQTVLTARHPTWTAPAGHDRRQLVQQCLRSGAAHAAASPDRLLLVFGLLLLVAPAARRLVQALAAFAVGHAVALAAGATGLLTVSPRTIDLILAAAVLVLALDVVRGADGGASVRRFAAPLALALGLLSGAASAPAFVAAGVPSLDAPLALLAFTAGSGITQVAPALTLAFLTARALPRTNALVIRGAAYGMGVLAVFWCLQRLSA